MKRLSWLSFSCDRLFFCVLAWLTAAGKRLIRSRQNSMEPYAYRCEGSDRSIPYV